MGLDELLNDAKYKEIMDKILSEVSPEYRKIVIETIRPTPQEAAYFGSIIPAIFNRVKQDGKKILEEAFSEYDEKSLRVIESAIKFLYDSGHVNLEVAYSIANDEDVREKIRKIAREYRVSPVDVGVDMFGKFLSNLALVSSKNPKVANYIESLARSVTAIRGDREAGFIKEIVEYMRAGIISTLINNGVNPAKFWEEYEKYIELIGKAWTDYYISVVEYYGFDKGITKVKIPMLSTSYSLAEKNKEFTYDYPKEVINSVLSKKKEKKEEGEKKEGGEEVKELPKEEEKIEEELEEKPPLPYIP